jgi:hypothetical protein
MALELVNGGNAVVVDKSGCGCRSLARQDFAGAQLALLVASGGCQV